MNILLPVGRMVWGNLTEAVARKDYFTKQPKLDKDGKQVMSWELGVAIPKGSESDWKQTGWGQKIVEVATGAFPQGQHMSPSFAWKIVDGDSQIPNKAGTILAKKEGFAGHWVLNCGTMLAPKLVNRDGTAPILDRSIVRAGHYIQVLLMVKGNDSQQTPGMYLNAQIVAHSAIGKEIVQESVDASKVGFGGDLPVGATSHAAQPTAQPVQTFAPMTLTPPPPVMTPPPVMAPARVMTDKASAPYESYIAAGWTDDVLRAHGLML